MSKRRKRYLGFSPHHLEQLEPRILLDGDDWGDDLSGALDSFSSDISSIDAQPSPEPTSSDNTSSDNGSSDNSSYDNSADDSDLSSAPTPNPPGRPIGVTALPLSDSSIQLSWQQPGNDADGFDITRRGPNGRQVIAEVSSDTRTYIDQGLLPGTNYSYVVSAFNDGGETDSHAAAVGTLGDHLTLTQQPASSTAGASLGFAVALRDAANVTDAAATSTLNVSVASGPAGAALTGPVFVQANAGVATFSGLSLTVAGTYRLTITDGISTVTTQSFTIKADASTAHLVLLSQPQAGIINKGLGLRIGVEDAFGNLVTAGKSAVTLSLASPGSLKGRLTVPVSKGVATFGSAALSTAGPFTLEAQDAALAGAPLEFTQQIAPAAVTLSTPKMAAGGYVFGKAQGLSVTLKSAPAVPFTGDATLVAQDGATLATGTVNANGTVHFSLSLTAGSYTAAIVYAGDANHAEGTSRSFTFKVAPAVTTTLLQASATRLAAGDPLTLTALVASAAGVIPTGSVTFLSGKTVLGVFTLDDAGTAVFTLSSLSQGPHMLTAVYSGDALAKSSRSKELRLTITPSV